ncbi:hypothetical protein BDN70DRAFT_852734 [Pholiota conissans]|uniref:CSN8/PSMD8/EIF3K domain-containing protein n=1 Tax=Pholiota conissans TaxID=109636 RepID=A0A9P6D4N8_9AGAR|nr:hypothetical protein BDN70DRAFT_852734 [Pholiota conissans]
MANGPPTPPATTAVELQDAARASAPIAEISAPATAQSDNLLRPEVYQRVIPAMVEAITQKNYQVLIDLAEEAEYMIAKERQPIRLFVIAPLVLAYLIRDNAPPARHALHRLSENLATLPLSRALSSIVVSTMNRQHAQLYEQVNALTSLVSQPDFFDRNLGSVIHDLTAVFLESFRQRTFELLSTAYTSLPSSLACVYLGLPAEQIINVAENNGWSYEPSSQILSPKHNSNTFGTSPSGFSSLNTFHFVADSVAQLES